MKTLTLLLTALLLFFPSAIYGKTKITSVSFHRADQDMGRLVVNFQKPLNERPSLTTREKIIQVLVPNSFVWPMIKKNIAVDEKLDMKIMAYQYTKDLVRVRAIFPHGIDNIKSDIKLVEKEKSMEILFPLVKEKVASVTKTPLKTAKKTPDTIEGYDESYLETLLNKKEIEKNEREDTVGLKLSGPEKAGTVSLPWYIGKFIFFLAVILLGFIGLVALLKRSVFAKRKLGLLYNTDIVEVLSKTYIAPKKSILAVKAYKQVILLGVDEKGMHFLTEIKSPINVLKDGEKNLAGDNFDTNIDDADRKDKEFNLKEILDKPATGKKEDKVKFSERIKNKVRGLKALQ